MNKTQTKYKLWLLAITVFASCLISFYGKETQSLIEEYGKDASQPTRSINKREIKVSGSGVVGQSATRLHKTSCYTAIESHGANGRNEWSVATYLYPQGTKLFIEGIGFKVVETVTSRKYADRLDIWFGDNYEKCLEYGVQLRKVTVIQ